MRFKSYFFLVVLVLFIGVLFCNCQKEEVEVPKAPDIDRAKIQEAIQGKHDELSTLIETRDVDALKEFIANCTTENTILIVPGRDMIKGREAVYEFWSSMIEMGIRNLSFKVEEVRAYSITSLEGYDLVALSIGTYSYEIQEEGKEALDLSGYFGCHWRHRYDCSWECIFGMMN